jgi:hypothetical protein
VSFHTVAFTAPTASSQLTPLNLVTDQFFSASGSTAFLLPSEMTLIGAYVLGAGLRRARVNSPSLLRVGFPFVRPIEVSANPVTDPNVMVLHHSHLHFPTGEPVGIDIAGDSGVVTGLLWFTPGHVHKHEGGHAQHGGEWQAQGAHDHERHASMHESFWLRYTITTAGNPGATTPLVWTQLVPTFDQTLPSGTYAVRGFEHIGPTAIAARLIFPGSVFRPGTVAMTSVGARTHRAFYEGSFGMFGVFRTISPPYVEVLTTGADNPGGSLDANGHEGYLRIVRLGDLAADHGRHGDGHPIVGLPPTPPGALAPSPPRLPMR